MGEEADGDDDDVGRVDDAEPGERGDESADDTEPTQGDDGVGSEGSDDSESREDDGGRAREIGADGETGADGEDHAAAPGEDESTGTAESSATDGRESDGGGGATGGEASDATADGDGDTVDDIAGDDGDVAEDSDAAEDGDTADDSDTSEDGDETVFPPDDDRIGIDPEYDATPDDGTVTEHDGVTHLPEHEEHPKDLDEDEEFDIEEHPVSDGALEGQDSLEHDEPLLGGGPDSDEEMPLADHVSEMIQRVGVVIFIAGVVGVVAFPFGEEIIRFLWQNALPVETSWQGPPAANSVRPHLYSPPELLITQIKVASLIGFVIALPALVYQSYRFMRPGLYPHERRYYLAAVPTSLILAFVGLVFAHFIVIPSVFTYFYQYTAKTADLAFALGKTLNLILILMGYLALVFQIPLFIMLAIMMGLVTRRWLAQRRLLFWGGFLGVSFLFSPDPTGMSPIIIAVTMIVLFEGTLFLVKWTRRGKQRVGG